MADRWPVVRKWRCGCSWTHGEHQLTICDQHHSEKSRKALSKNKHRQAGPYSAFRLKKNRSPL